MFGTGLLEMIVILAAALPAPACSPAKGGNACREIMNQGKESLSRETGEDSSVQEAPGAPRSIRCKSA